MIPLESAFQRGISIGSAVFAVHAHVANTLTHRHTDDHATCDTWRNRPHLCYICMRCGRKRRDDLHLTFRRQFATKRRDKVRLFSATFQRSSICLHAPGGNCQCSKRIEDAIYSTASCLFLLLLILIFAWKHVSKRRGVKLHVSAKIILIRIVHKVCTYSDNTNRWTTKLATLQSYRQQLRLSVPPFGELNEIYNIVFDSGLLTPLCEHMTSLAKPEVHNVQNNVNYSIPLFY